MSEHGPADRERRVASVVTGVIAAAVRSAAATGVVLVDDGSPEARLARAWCQAAVGPSAVAVLPASAADSVESALQRAISDLAASGAAGERGEGEATERIAELEATEARRAAARWVATRRGALLVGSANKTALLLERVPAPEALLPLGDLWGSQVKALAGDWSAPLPVRQLAEAAGGVEVLDRALARWSDRRESMATALRELPERVRAPVRDALDAARFARRRVGLVPKLGPRTLGIDLLA